MDGYRGISFTTDYGTADGFVAACHGVARTIAAPAWLIDVGHDVRPGDVRGGALLLAQVAPYLPPATVHVAVVDPGVGTARRAVAVVAGPAVLVGPDNGLLLPAADALGGLSGAFALTDSSLFRHPVSRTFHGRDVFMPVAAHLVRGVPVASCGPAVPPESLVRLPAPTIRADGPALTVEAQAVDRFGNIQLPVRVSDLPPAPVTVDGHRATVAGTFGDVPAGELVLYTDSAGLAALAVNGGSAAALLTIEPGDLLTLAPA